MDKESVSDKGATQSGSTTKTRWTIMLYIVADGALANFAVESLKQLTEFASIAFWWMTSANVVVGAQFAFPTRCSAARIRGSEKASGRTEQTPHILFKRGNGGDPQCQPITSSVDNNDGSSKASPTSRQRTK